MNPSRFLIVAAILPGVFLSAQEKDPGCCGNNNAGPVFRDAATNKSLSAHGAARENPIAGLRSAQPPEEAMNSKAYKPESIIARSEVIHRGKLATLVPKRAVLHLPADLRGSVGLPEGVQLISWAEFFKMNRNWIRTLEVTRAQAEGEIALSEETVESFKESRHLIVATYQTGPISVMPLKEEPEEPEISKISKP